MQPDGRWFRGVQFTPVESDVRDQTLIRFGLRLRMLRKAHGWSQESLAERMTRQGHRLVQTQIAKMEAGQRATTVDELVALARILDLDPCELLQPPPETKAQRELFEAEMELRTAEDDVVAAELGIEMMMLQLGKQLDKRKAERDAAAERLKAAREAVDDG